jgi:hypothetical protein
VYRYSIALPIVDARVQRKRGGGGIINTIFAHPQIGELSFFHYVRFGGLLNSEDYPACALAGLFRRVGFYLIQRRLVILATASVNCALLRFHVVINTQPSRSFKLPGKYDFLFYQCTSWLFCYSSNLSFSQILSPWLEEYS